ncbi:MAG TPA: glycosyl hydrolase [Verrucomicrobiae bacterium]|nr:glycosyl hydrolase [Verrucomicrobiae bacterium]
MRTNLFLLPVLASVLFMLTGHAAPTDLLESGFLHPPDSARPQTWWHWMNGNITQTGLTADLEAMKQIGLGGATIVNVDCGIPRGPVSFMSPEWRADFKFAVQEADRLGLKLCVENCAGWSSSGGPWNTATNAMQRVTTSELMVTGPTNFDATLPQPPTSLDFYRDIAVLAYPAPADAATIPDIDNKDGRNDGAVLSSPDAGDSTRGAVQTGKIIDLTSRLSADGQLKWTCPAGKWVILRVGYTPTGVDNHPAPKEGTGLECDKLSKTALDVHWAGFMQKILDDIGPLAGKTLDSSLIDSYEVGGQNWTKKFREEFKRRRGYDPLKFLPVFTGQVVDNPEVSERFLWDVRRTIADLFAENYYGHFAELCRKHGLLNAVEPYEGPFESLQCGAPADVVMGEFWSGSQGNPSVKMVASIAHIYGKTIVGAESFTAAPGPHTGRWQEYPYALKTLGDLMFCQGLNRYIFHRYAMQPWTNRWPGMTMGQWGFHFERTETWWSQGKPWIDYITRCQFLLQQGRAVADAAYFDGQSAPVEMRVGNPALPAGYDYDAVDAQVLLHGATVRNGRLTLASGANYALLVLPPDDINMTPQMLKCIRKLVHAGATVVGPRPQHSPSLQNYPQCDRRVKKLAAKLWGKCDGDSVRENKYGRGRIVLGKSLAEVFASQNLKPDFEFEGASAATHLAYAHRVAGAADIYFVSNQRQRFDSVECTFRVSGKAPELWHPDTGVIEPAPVWYAAAGRTTVRLDFDPAGSVFVVFRHATGGADHPVSAEGHAPEVVTAKPAELKILKAVYGPVPNRDDNPLDVTAKVKALVAKGTRRIPADNGMAGENPAGNTVKQLRIEFRLNGESQTNEVEEGKTLEIPAGADIVRALYGDLHAETPSAGQAVDLTGKLDDLAKAGELNVSVNNELAGRDPAVGTPKELCVDYTLDGKPGQVTTHEGDTLTLPATLSYGQAPLWETSVAADGSPVVTAWSDGRVALRTADGRVLRAIASDVPAPQTVTGPWNLNFPPNWGAPPSITLEQLISWTDHTNNGVRYFSGTATYEKEIEIPADRLTPGRELWLDLGEVKNFAEVSLNGRDFGVLWRPPFRVNLTHAAKPGVNQLVIKVTNLWPNRLIGDEQLPPDCEWNGDQLKEWPQWLLDGRPSPTGRLTFTTWHHYAKDSPLLQSGLLGPVTLQTAERVRAH